MDMNKVNANCVTYEQTFLSMIQQIETNFQLRDTIFSNTRVCIGHRLCFGKDMF